MTRSTAATAIALLLALSLPAARLFAADAPARKPNIVLIYADDLGYGDIGCYGATKVKTPNIDKLASQGLRFTDAHCTAATCTPSRYSLMTGQYAWRKKGTGILPGDAALIIDTKKATTPNVLKSAGYTSAAIGKWHMGLGEGKIDWNGEIKPGPLEVGFDYCFIIPATVDRTPCVYVENHRIANLDANDPLQVNYKQKVGDEPTGKEHPELLKMKLTHGHDQTIVNGISRIGYMAGAKNARWKDEDIADVFTSHAVSFIEKNKDKPFFLYLATHDVHVPRVPHQRFAGGSQAGTRGDVVQEFDWTVGQVVDTIDKLGLANDTLILVSSDNGPVLDDGYDDTSKRQPGLAMNLPMIDAFGHTPAGSYRGGKYTPYEGGTRVPLVVRYPGKIAPGTTSDALVCQVDFLASFAALAGAKVPEGGGPDSQDLHAAFLGQEKKGREVLIEQGGPLAIRKGNWKLIPKGNLTKPFAQRAAGQKTELYDLSKDVAEQTNVADKNQELVAQLEAEFQKITGRGAGPAEPNSAIRE